MGALMRILLVALILVGCSGKERPLQFNMGVEAVQLDWNRAIDSASVVLIDNIMEGLTTYSGSLQGNEADLVRPLPALASSWSISEGGKVYRFHLKPGVTWTDGVELKAQQFVDSWERLLSPGFRSANAYHLFDIENAKNYSEGKEKDFSRVGVRALDNHTLEVRLRRQAPYFLHLVASASTYPIRKDLIEKFSEAWTDPENLVTLGPYRIMDWVPADRILLQVFPDYSGPLPAISRVICRFVSEPLTAFALYENGALDILPRDLPSPFIKRLQQGAEYRTGPKLQVSYLLFNTRRPPFDRKENRRTFIRALNREQLALYFRGTQAPTRGWVPPGLLGFRENIGIAAEGKESKLLAGKSVEIRYSGSDTWNLVFQTIQRQLAEKLTLQAKLSPSDGAEYSDLLAQLSDPNRTKNAPHILHMGWVADYPDSHSFMNVFTSTSESNYSGWANAEYDRLVEKAVSTTEESVRSQFYQRAQEILLEDEAVLMPLFFTSHQALVRTEVQGVQLNVLDKWYFKNLNFERSGWRGFGRSFLRRLRQANSGDGA